jgi:hypothetical protein
MSFLEDMRVLHPDGRQFVDVEKTPIIDLLGGYLPMREAINLLIEEIIQEVKTSWMVWIAIESF